MVENTVKKSSDKKKQFIIFGLCSVLALALCMITLVVTVNTLNDGSANSSDTKQLPSKTSLTDNSAELSGYIQALTDYARGNKFVKVNTYTDITVDDAKINVTDSSGKNSDTDKELFVYLKNKVLASVDGFYTADYTGIFGEVYSNMPTVELEGLQLSDCDLSVGLTDQDGNSVYDENGVIVDGDYYYITFVANGENVLHNELFETAFGLHKAPETGELFKEKIAENCTVENSDVAPSDFSLTAKVNRFTDEIAYIQIDRVYDVSADLIFINKLSVFGIKKVAFEYKVSQRYDYFYAGISFAQSELTVEQGSEGVLNVNAVIEDDSDYIVTFTSSDNSVATVDEMGYVKGVKESSAPVVITVTLDYLGEKFTDECTVYVKSSDKAKQG